MIKRLAATLSFVAILGGCAGGGGGSSTFPAVEVFIGTAGGALNPLPVDFASTVRFAPDGRLFFTELNTGKVQVFQNGALTTFHTFFVSTVGEQGLLGMALDPDFATNKYIYFFATHPTPLRNRIIRLTDNAGVGSDFTVLVDNLPATDNHNGGRLAFGPDGKLYVSIGDNQSPSNSQNPNVVSGKILRYNSDGTIPADNPIAGNPLFSLGLRNTFGLAFHPSLNVLFGSENGPTCDDEVNRLVSNGNYGWRPGIQCGDDHSGFVPPVLRINPVIAPTGIAFYTGTVFPEWTNRILMTTVNDGSLWLLTLNGAGTAVTRQDLLFSNLGNGLIDVTVGPDGNIYLAGINGILRIVRR